MQLEPTTLPWKLRAAIFAVAIVAALNVPTLYYFCIKMVRLVDLISHMQRAPKPTEPGVVTVGIVDQKKVP